MEHTIALIKRSHEGDEKARTQLVEENVGLVCSQTFLWQRNGAGGFVSDWKHRPVKGD